MYSKPLINNPRINFDPRNNEHMWVYGEFLRKMNWMHGCPFALEKPFTDIPAMIQYKIATATALDFLDKNQS